MDTPIDDDFRMLLGQGAKQGGLALSNPVTGAERLHKASLDANALLVSALLANENVMTGEHRKCVRKAGADYREGRVEMEELFLIDFGKEKGKKVAKRVERYEENSAWLSIIPSTLDGTEVTRDEWLDNIKIRYGHRPKGLPYRCDGCGKG